MTARIVTPSTHIHKLSGPPLPNLSRVAKLSLRRAVTSSGMPGLHARTPLESNTAVSSSRAGVVPTDGSASTSTYFPTTRSHCQTHRRTVSLVTSSPTIETTWAAWGRSSARTARSTSAALRRPGLVQRRRRSFGGTSKNGEKSKRVRISLDSPRCFNTSFSSLFPTLPVTPAAAVSAPAYVVNFVMAWVDDCCVGAKRIRHPLTLPLSPSTLRPALHLFTVLLSRVTYSNLSALQFVSSSTGVWRSLHMSPS